jgi:hypothetical protein
MLYVTGDSHYIESSMVAQNIDEFNERLMEEGYDQTATGYEQRERSYVKDVQSGDYNSDYKRIQIDNAIKRINAQIAHMKPSSDGRVLAPGEEAQGMSMDTAPSGSDSYREFYMKEMSKRVNKDPMPESPVENVCHKRRRHRSATVDPVMRNASIA